MSSSLLDLYSDYLISSFGQTSATGLSRLTGGVISHDRITRFLSEPQKTGADLWHKVKPLVRQLQSSEGVLIFDDTIEEKPYTDENDIICWHWDHSQNRNVKGINFITALYQYADQSIPVSFDIVAKTEAYTDPKTDTLRRRSAITKNQRFRTMLRQGVKNQLPFSYILADTWFASAENMRYITLDLDKAFIFPLKTNRKIALSQADRQHGRYQRVDTLPIKPGTVHTVYLEDVPFPLQFTAVVFTNEDGTTGHLYLVSSDTTTTCEQLETSYQKRWKVEEYHKSIKQNASLEKSPTRTQTTQTNHLFAALWAFVKLECLKQATATNHFALKTKLYFQALHSAFEELQRLKRDASPLPIAA